MPPLPLSPALRRMLAGLLIAALTTMQALGLLHRTLAGHGLPSSSAGALAAPSEHGAAPLQALFAEHDDERDCRLFDQLAQADAAPGGAPATVALALPEALPVVHAAAHFAPQAAGFLARGPPRRA